jgi:hypothetical protein
LELGKRLGMHVPGEIRIYAIEIEDNQTFSETCSPSVERAIPRIVKEIAERECFVFGRKSLGCREEAPNTKHPMTDKFQ